MFLVGGAVLQIPASVGEVADKITILRIKAARIREDEKLQNIHRELGELERIFFSRFPDLAHAVHDDIQALQVINERLWVIEDDIRDCERAGEFGPAFIALARAVYLTNDQRWQVKRRIDAALGSLFVEEKSYRDISWEPGSVAADAPG